jgi:(2R)-3-sulfolactate dehydrogenase (NADP+)
MSDLMTLSIKETRSLILKALTGVGIAARNAHYLTEAILDSELSGLEDQGLLSLPSYCLHVKSRKVDGKARPKVKKITPTAFMVDAKGGLAHPAIEKGFEKLVPAAEKFGIAAMGVAHSYSAGTLGFHTGTLAKQGLLALGFTNSMATMAPIGGNIPIIGSNPMSCAVPGRRGKIKFLIDQSASHVTWTAVKHAEMDKRKIPLGWSFDKEGNPTTDPVKGLGGSMVPAGGVKGFNQGLIVEVLCAAMTGSALGSQMGSFTETDDVPINNGQFFIALSPKSFGAKHFNAIIDELVENIVSQNGARLPHSRREAHQARLAKAGIPISRALHERILGFAK